MSREEATQYGAKELGRPIFQCHTEMQERARYELLYIRELTPVLVTQSDSIRAIVCLSIGTDPIC